MACNFKTMIEFRLPVKKAIEVIRYCEAREVDYNGMGDYDPYDYDSDLKSLTFNNTVWMNNNLNNIIKNCDLGEGTVFKKVFENVYEYPATCFLPKEDILIY